jgi:hypothetical protein
MSCSKHAGKRSQERSRPSHAHPNASSLPFQLPPLYSHNKRSLARKRTRSANWDVIAASQAHRSAVARREAQCRSSEAELEAAPSRTEARSGNPGVRSRLYTSGENFRVPGKLSPQSIAPRPLHSPIARPTASALAWSIRRSPPPRSPGLDVVLAVRPGPPLRLAHPSPHLDRLRGPNRRLELRPPHSSWGLDDVPSP